MAEELPANLREWFSDVTLVAWIEEEIKRFDRNHPYVALYFQGHPEDDPAMMALVLAFSFACELFPSEDIARACRFDPAFYHLCNGRPPFPQQLSTFRRGNRPMLVLVLTSVFKRAISQKFALSPALLAPRIARELHDNAVERLDLARHMDNTSDTVVQNC